MFHFEHKEEARAPRTNTGHLNPSPRQRYSACCLLAKEERTKQGECRALVVKGHMGNPWYRFRPLPAAPLVVRRRRLIEVPSPLPAALLVVRRTVLWPLRRCTSRVLNRGAQADARGATQVLDRGG
jgi:hypothetical protein